MYSTQVSLTGLSETTLRQVASNRVHQDSGSEGDFALVYESILGLSADQCSESAVSDNWLNDDSGNEPNLVYTSLDVPVPSYGGSGTGARQFTGSDGPAASKLAGDLTPGNGVGRQLSPEGGAQPLPTASLGRAGKGASVDKTPGTSDGIIADSAPPSISSDNFDKHQFSNWLDAHALSRSSHHCARYVRLGMEAAGLNTTDRPPSGDAGDYGSFLLKHGAQTVSPDSYEPQTGDVVVFDKTVQHPYGHIQTYDGQRWVSDFMQNSFSPYRNSQTTPTFTIYRLA